MRALVALVCALAVVLAGGAPADAAAERKGRTGCAPAAKKQPAKAKVKPQARVRATVTKAKAKRRCRRPAARKRALAPRPSAVPALRPAVNIAPPDAVTGATGPAPAPGAPAAAPPVAGSPAAATPAPADAPAAPTCNLASPWLGVTAEDADGVFRLRLSRTCVPAGRVLVQYRNVDLQPHNLYAEGVSPAAPRRAVVADLEGESSTDGAVDLAPGTWRLLCTIPGHEAMQQTVTALR